MFQVVSSSAMRLTLECPSPHLPSVWKTLRGSLRAQAIRGGRVRMVWKDLLVGIAKCGVVVLAALCGSQCPRGAP